MSPASLTALESTILPDGRRISFSAIGPQDGHPVLYMHGAVGSPLRRAPELDRAIASLGIRYLMIDRPGFRGSDPLPGRAVIDTAADVELLADGLGLGRFGVVGVSAGAPYALACAARMPDRVRTTLVSPLSPTVSLHANPEARLRYRLGLGAVAHAPGAVSWLGDRVAALMRRHPGLAVRLIEVGASEADRALLAEPVRRQALAERFLFAFSARSRPMVDDYRVCCRPWGFDVSDIAAPVQLWHGMQDNLVPAATAFRLASELPEASLSIVLDEGHFFFLRRVRDILAPLLGVAEGAASELARPRVIAA